MIWEDIILFKNKKLKSEIVQRLIWNLKFNNKRILFYHTSENKLSSNQEELLVLLNGGSNKVTK